MNLLKVLVHFDFGTMSHINPLLEVGSVLRARNHSVIYAAADHNAKYNKPYGFEFKSLGTTFDDPKMARSIMKEAFAKRQRVDADIVFDSFSFIMPESYKGVFPKLSQVVDQEKPDVMICDFFSPACRDVALTSGIPLVTGFQSTDGFGNDRAPFVTTALDYVPITTHSMTLLQRINDKAIVPLRSMYKTYPLIRELNKARKQFNVPPSSQPLGDFSNELALANTFIGFEAAAPVPSNIRMIGPLKMESPNKLSPDLEAFLDSHPNTIYIAFGTKVVLADFDVHNLIKGSIAALEEGSIDGVVWGLGSTSRQEFPEARYGNLSIFDHQHPNFRLLEWAPQSAILDHPHTKLFVSHGGTESSFEAIFSATPVLCMPFFSDQPRNARKLEDAGIGKYIDRIIATPASISNHITTMLRDKDGLIQSNVKRMQTLAQFGSRRKEMGADSIEEYAYTARACRPAYPYKFGHVSCEAKHLISVTQKMSYIQSNLLDVYFLTAASFFLTLSPFIYGLMRLLKFIFDLSAQNSPPVKKKIQ